MFGTERVRVTEHALHVGNHGYPIIDDVVILIEPAQCTPYVRSRLEMSSASETYPSQSTDSIQFTFGEEWKTYSEIIPEHRQEFDRYFDLINLSSLGGARVCDLGCGIGRWSYFLREFCREIVLVDFSDAVFVARRNLRESDKCLFFMGDLRRLPFRENFCDFLFSLGVLHHLPTPCLTEVRQLRASAPRV